MIRISNAPRPVRSAAAAASVLGVIALAGCASGAATADPAETTAPSATPTPTSAATGTQTPAAPAESASTYADGSYTAQGSYQTPESVETISVTVTLADDIITAVEVTGDPQKAESAKYQGEFIGGISEVVVGQDIDTISVSRVAGSSLTSGGFNAAIEQIKAEAAA